MKEYKTVNRIQSDSWFHTLPVGNGRMGVAATGVVAEETLYLNEETVWASRPQPAKSADFAEKLHTARDMFLNGKPYEADKYINENLKDDFTRICSFESAGRLKIFPDHGAAYRNYEKRLDLMRGVGSVEYDVGSSHFTREYTASHPDDVAAFYMSSSNGRFGATFAYEHEKRISAKASGDTLVYISETSRGEHRFCVRIKIETDGEIISFGDALKVESATKICAFIDIRTAFRRGDYATYESFPRSGYEKYREAHIADFSSLMSRAEISLPEVEGFDELSVRERLLAHGNNKTGDNGLIMLYWQFGRYLLISSSREGTLPANLQGVWSRDCCSAPWSCDYHLNINLQMNYWAAENTNLSDCHSQLFDYMNEFLLPAGKKCAAENFKTRGCVVHHLSDIYGFATPADGPWGLWPHGASWLAFHMWEHYLYTRDEAFLRDKAYNFIRESAIFFLDNMVEDKNGRLIYGPSTSPENFYFVNDENGERKTSFTTVSSTMDVEIIGGLLKIYAAASDILGISDKDIEYARVAVKKLPPLKVGKYGQLCEWIEDYDEAEVDHRHISHAFAFFPDCAINRKTPELLRAVEKTVERRTASGGWRVGWGYTWLCAIYARLRRPEDAYNMLFTFLCNASSENLFDIYRHTSSAPTHFQIDANCAFTAAVTEMLMQSHEDVIALIPALPKLWDHGSFKGLCARGGFRLDLKWENFEVSELTVYPSFDGECTFELPSSQKCFEFCGDDGKLYTANGGLLTVSGSNPLHLTKKN